MQEKSFKFKESFGAAISAMDDKTAGKFIKSVCDYVFDNKLPESNDSTLKSAFTLIRNTLDEERRDKMYGKIGGQKSAEMKKKQQSVIDIRVGKVSAENPMDMLKAVMGNDISKPKK